MSLRPLTIPPHASSFSIRTAISSKPAAPDSTLSGDAGLA
jgi:hypothetical protein